MSWKLYADGTVGLQSVDGFGAAWTDATVTVFDSLPPQLQDELMQDLFSTPDGGGSSGGGLGLSLMRHTVGQSDLTPASIGEWSYDSNGGTPDPSLEHFALTQPGERMAGWLKKMYVINPEVMLLGSPWPVEISFATENMLEGTAGLLCQPISGLSVR